MFRLFIVDIFNHRKFYSFLLTILSCYYVSARDTIPEWFFYINPGEYVGVSLPENDNRYADARRNLALIVAGVQQRLSSKNNSLLDFIDSKGIFRFNQSREDSIHFSYRLIDKYVNDNGEEFIKITTETGDECVIYMYFRQDIRWQGNGSFDMKNDCSVFLRRADSETSIHMVYKYNYAQGQRPFIDIIELRGRSVSLNRKYEYVYDSDLSAQNSYHYPECGCPSNMCVSLSCDNSLFAAFVKTYFHHVEGKRIYPTGIKDNHLYYLNY